MFNLSQNHKTKCLSLQGIKMHNQRKWDVMTMKHLSQKLKIINFLEELSINVYLSINLLARGL